MPNYMIKASTMEKDFAIFISDIVLDPKINHEQSALLRYKI